MMEEVTAPRVLGAVAAYLMIDALIRMFLVPSARLPYDKVVSMAKKRFNGTDDQPLHNKVAIITGSTSGIGQQIATDLYRMGATVILASRTHSKMVEVADLIRKEHPDCTGVLVTEKAMDSSDLDSVVEFVRWFRGRYSSLHFLVNNAGIVYLPSQHFDPHAPPTSKQNYDLAFATNYLGHFLLTELMLSTLKSTPDARILNVASTAHLTVSGRDLECGANGGAPRCAAPARTTAAYFGAYGNNKLAQIMHVQELQRELSADSKSSNGLKILCTCPGFTATNMLPKTLLGNILKKLFFPVECATYAPLSALLSPEAQGGEFRTNFFVFWTDHFFGRLWFDISCAIGMRVPFAGFVAVPWVIAFQNSSYGVHITTPGSAARNETAARELLQWSRQEVKTYTDKLKKASQ